MFVGAGRGLGQEYFFYRKNFTLLTGAVHLSPFEYKTLKVLRSSKYSLLTCLAYFPAGKYDSGFQVSPASQAVGSLAPSFVSLTVGAGRLELPCLATYAPEAYAYTNSATHPFISRYYTMY